MNDVKLLEAQHSTSELENFFKDNKKYKLVKTGDFIHPKFKGDVHVTYSDNYLKILKALDRFNEEELLTLLPIIKEYFKYTVSKVLRKKMCRDEVLDYLRKNPKYQLDVLPKLKVRELITLTYRSEYLEVTRKLYTDTATLDNLNILRKYLPTLEK